MNIKAALLQEHSKSQTLLISDFIGADKDLFQELLKLFLEDEYRVTQRAAWVVSKCSEKYPELIKPHLKSIIQNLKRPVPDAVKRNTLRILQHLDIPEALRGTLATICFKYLEANEPIAIKCFAMHVLANITLLEPDLKNELRLVIEDQLPYATPAFHSRSVKVLKQLETVLKPKNLE